MNHRVGCWTSKWEAMVDFGLVHESWFATKAEHRILLVIVVRLQNTSNHINSCFVLVCWSHKVKWVIVCGLSIGSRVIDCNGERDLPSTSQVVREFGFCGLDRFWLRLRCFELLGCYSSQDEARFMIFVVRVLKLDFENLLFSCHDFAHTGFKEAHTLSRFIFVWIPDLKL